MRNIHFVELLLKYEHIYSGMCSKEHCQDFYFSSNIHILLSSLSPQFQLYLFWFLPSEWNDFKYKLNNNFNNFLFVFQPAYVVHIFPPCEFSQITMEKLGFDLLHQVKDLAHLLIIIATVGWRSPCSPLWERWFNLWYGQVMSGTPLRFQCWRRSSTNIGYEWPLTGF